MQRLWSVLSASGFLPFAMVWGALLALFVLWKFPVWQVSRVRGLDSKERFDRENEARKTLATVLGGILLLAGAAFTWRNIRLAQDSLRVSQQGQVTERFTKAIEQLGTIDGKNPKLETRLGAIYSLEAVANESESLNWPIIEVLCTYVRLNSPALGNGSTANLHSGAGVASATNVMSAKWPHPREDIQAILNVLGRRNPEPEAEYYPNLPEADGPVSVLPVLNYHGVNLAATEHHLNLGGVDLQGADLHGANLSRAIFYSADLSTYIIRSLPNLAKPSACRR